jgi:hypothetical protein
MPARMGGRERRRFDQHLVLQLVLLRSFGTERLDELTEALQAPELEGVDEDGIHRFAHVLRARLAPPARFSPEDLYRYDENIVRHTRAINSHRDSPITWKYFQYLALLFVEIYLDHFFRDFSSLLADLNRNLEEINATWPDNERLPIYTPGDLRKVAFWTATGSGKTLLMHVNVLQYREYARRYGREGDLNRILLLTPSETLSRQHLAELERSGIPAELFSKHYRSLFVGEAVEILEVYRLKEEGKEKTVAVEGFEQNNLVLVDEGHRGARGYEWKDKRDQLSEEGFCFEYSATFGQAVGNDEALYHEYAKAVLLDYSYRRFHRDGYGKDFRILNLADDRERTNRELYITACLLTHYQQQRVFRDHTASLRKYRVQRPLWIFVGSTVTGGRVIPDVVEVLKFLSRFASDRGSAIRRIERLLSGKPGLLDSEDREVFAEAFPYVRDLKLSPSKLYDDILSTVFNAPQGGAVHVEPLRDGGGEIRLRVGASDELFGLINVGDVSKLCDLCEAQEELVVREPVIGVPLFDSVGSTDSRVNILVGSKKFSEGWDSWRVGTMGLLNVGRGEGSEIIQLFGRGVRLQGIGYCLKRSAFANDSERPPPYLRFLETLYVFGVRADYMDQFREFLQQEGIPDQERPVEIRMPVVRRQLPAGLKVIQARAGAAEALRTAAFLLEVVPIGLVRRVVTLDWYPRLQLSESHKSGVAAARPETGALGPDQLRFLDFDQLYLDLQGYKSERGWHQVLIEREKLHGILADQSWYRLFIPPSELRLDSFEQTAKWQEIALTLLKKYTAWYVRYRLTEAQRPFLEYRVLSNEDPNLLEEYAVKVPQAAGAHLSSLERIRDQLLQKKVAVGTVGNIELFEAGPHLYQPLIAARAGDIQVSPAPLNEGEKRFVNDLTEFLRKRPKVVEGREVYLLRNQSRGRGLAVFAQGNFYPDFLLWIVEGPRQFLTFVDPKGIAHLQGLDDPKIQFHKTVEALQSELNDPQIVLHSFIISNTPFSVVRSWRDTGDKSEFVAQGVLFQNDDRDTYVHTMFDQIVR